MFCGAVVLLGSGCGGGSGSEVNGSGVSSGQGASSASTGSGAETGNDINHGGATGSGANHGGGGRIILDVAGTSSGGATQNTGDGTPELCDGVDNDSNDIIDDVDAGHDGVCDCLNIATIGHIGPWSNGGNIFKSWLNARSPLGAVELADEELSADKLKKFQIIVVLHADTTTIENKGVTAPGHHVFADGEVSAFEAWVRAGGGVMTTIGYTNNEANEVVNVNKLLAGLGMGYSTTKLGLSGNVSDWLAHPVSDGISNIFTDNGAEPDGPSGMTIAHGGDKVALQVSQADLGRVAVWGDEWVTYDSEWADVDGQQVEHFWLNLLKWLSPPGECQVPIPPRVK